MYICQFSQRHVCLYNTQQEKHTKLSEHTKCFQNNVTSSLALPDAIIGLPYNLVFKRILRFRRMFAVGFWAGF